MQVNDLCKWKEPGKGEEGDVMKVLEVNGDRLLVEYQNTGMTIKPTTVVRTADVEAK